MSLEQKRCTKCGVIKELSDFHKTALMKNGLQSQCKSCSNKGARNSQLKKKYGIDHKTYETIFKNQGSCCALCGSVESGRPYKNFAVDHNHETKEVRGLLCYNCNSGLGMFKDSPKLLKRAIQYLEENGHYGVWSDA
jgi:hypothetical protein